MQPPPPTPSPHFHPRLECSPHSPPSLSSCSSVLSHLRSFPDPQTELVTLRCAVGTSLCKHVLTAHPPGTVISGRPRPAGKPSMGSGRWVSASMPGPHRSSASRNKGADANWLVKQAFIYTQTIIFKYLRIVRNIERLHIYYPSLVLLQIVPRVKTLLYIYDCTYNVTYTSSIYVVSHIKVVFHWEKGVVIMLVPPK